MKPVLPALLIVTGSILGLACAGAQAADGNIHIIGEITDMTCSINGAGPGAQVDRSVDLGTVPASSLAAPGQVGGISAATDLVFELSGCSANAVSAIAKFENGPTVDQNTGTLMNQVVGPNGAQNVNVRLLNSQRLPINIVTGDGNRFGSDGTTITGGNATLTYFAQFYATGLAMPGLVDTSVQYTMTYQ